MPTRDELSSRQLAFFSRHSVDGATVQSVLAQARIALVGDGAVAEHTAANLAVAGMHTVPIAAGQFSDEAVRGASCILVCFDSPAPALLSKVNSAALKGGWPWIPGGIESGLGLIGPAVIPGQTACYQCFHLRRQANLGAGPATGENGGAPAPLAASAGSLLALEAMRLISRLTPPQSMNRVMVLDFFAPAIGSHRVLRLPNCPDCGYGSRRLPQGTAVSA